MRRRKRRHIILLDKWQAVMNKWYFDWDWWGCGLRRARATYRFDGPNDSKIKRLQPLDTIGFWLKFFAPLSPFTVYEFRACVCVPQQKINKILFIALSHLRIIVHARVEYIHAGTWKNGASCRTGTTWKCNKWAEWLTPRAFSTDRGGLTSL